MRPPRLRARFVPAVPNDDAEPMTGTLYAFGYAGFRESDDLHALLGDRADVVADIRLVPLSRDPTWSRRTRQTVEAAGYDYIHVPGLGNANYKNGGPVKLADPAAASAIIERLVRGENVAIMCVCWNPATCHRRHVADLVRKRLPSLEVIDL
jgi:uncharacterized protein (DUF488 family)